VHSIGKRPLNKIPGPGDTRFARSGNIKTGWVTLQTPTPLTFTLLNIFPVFSSTVTASEGSSSCGIDGTEYSAAPPPITIKTFLFQYY